MSTKSKLDRVLLPAGQPIKIQGVPFVLAEPCYALGNESNLTTISVEPKDTLQSFKQPSITTTPTPSDVAMAVARDFYGPVRADCEQIPAADKAFTSLEIQLAELIDRHFAPLREELARVKEELETHQINVQMANKMGSKILTAEDWYEMDRNCTTLRASNDKLRAALEAYVNADDWDARLEKNALAALAPERKETT